MPLAMMDLQEPDLLSHLNICKPKQLLCFTAQHHRQHRPVIPERRETNMESPQIAHLLQLLAWIEFTGYSTGRLERNRAQWRT